jgi:2-polyprenyl-6-methoxyphenol hydroxylase-like FAD-dependent oxidoreductase
VNQTDALDTYALIIGAGPTGLTLGIALLLQGRRVLVIDKHLSGLSYSRAILINGETLQALQPLGVCELLRAAGQPVDGLQVHVNGALRCTLRGAASSAVSPILLPQLHTEQILLERYLQLGGSLQRGYCYAEPEGSCTGKAGWVDLQTVDRSHPPSRVHYQWLFGCDGAHSAVRSALGLAWRGRKQPEPAYAIDADLQQWSADTNASLHISTLGIALALRIGPHSVRIAGTTQAQCLAVLQGLPVQAITWESAFNIQFRTAVGYGVGRAWLAGDAAHVHSPIGGRGMNMGMCDALALAEAVAQQDLRAYVKQRKPIAARWVGLNSRVSWVTMGQGPASRMLRWLLRCGLQLLLLCGGQRLLQGLFLRLVRGAPPS